MDELVLTRAGHAELERELERLREARAGVDERLRRAPPSAGDAGEVAEYLDVQLEQELLERRIGLLEERLASARVLGPDAPRSERLTLGCWAELEDLDSGERSRSVLVSSPETGPAEGRLSIESPVGRAIAGDRAGDAIEVSTPRGRRHLRVLAAGPG